MLRRVVARASFVAAMIAVAGHPVLHCRAVTSASDGSPAAPSPSPLPPSPWTTLTPAGPIAASKSHTVRFGAVGNENRGPAAMTPVIEHVDDHYWLRDDSRSRPEVIDHLKAENAFLQQRTQSLQPLIDTIYGEHVGHLKETDSSPPVWDGPFREYTRTVKGLSHAIYCRDRGPGTPEEVLLDVNAIAVGKSHCDVRSVETCPDGDRDVLAYAIDAKGDEVFQIRFTRLSQEKADDASSTMTTTCGATSPVPSINDVIDNTDGTLVWGRSRHEIFYVTKDDTKRSDKVWRHVMGTPQSQDACIYHEPDGLFSVGAGKTTDGGYLLVASISSETTEVHVARLEGFSSSSDSQSNALPTLVCLRPRQQGVRSYWPGLHVTSGATFLLTNRDGAYNNQLLWFPPPAATSAAAAPSSSSSLYSTPLDDSQKEVVLPHSESRMLDSMQIFRRFLVLHGREDGLTRLWTMDIDDISGRPLGGLRAITFDEPAFTVSLSSNPMYDQESVRLAYSSMTTPRTFYDYDVASGTKRLVKQVEVPGYNPQDYISDRLTAVAPDGRQISISMVRHKSVKLPSDPSSSTEASSGNNGTLGVRGPPHPTMLYGYGSYGICMEPSFSMTSLAYLQRGVVYCIAHVRGGGENGRQWYEKEGKYLTKKNTFTDFIACAEHLIKQGISEPSTLAIEGRSAGGLLVGAVMNMRPELFKAAVAGVPFVDVLTTMSDPTIPLTIGEWEEWGNPNERQYYDYMRSYSPMDNIRKGVRYPDVLIVAGLHDPRVAFWEPAKWATKLRLAQKELVPVDTEKDSKHDAGKSSSVRQQGDVLLKMDLDVGHFSASDRYRYLREQAFEQAFVISRIVSRPDA